MASIGLIVGVVAGGVLLAFGWEAQSAVLTPEVPAMPAGPAEIALCRRETAFLRKAPHGEAGAFDSELDDPDDSRCRSLANEVLDDYWLVSIRPQRRIQPNRRFSECSL